jgi:hypothetical protein
MTRNQQLMVMSAEIAMSMGLMYTGFKTYQAKGLEDKLSLAVLYGAGAYLAYGAYLNYQGRIDLLPGE